MATKMTKEEAIKKVRQMSLPKETMEILEALAPELAESEDERIRKWLIEYFEFASKCWIHRDITPGQIFTYLERQKEKALIPDELVENYKRFCEQGGRDLAAIINAINWQKEQKPDTRDDDDLQLLGFIYDLLNEIEWKDNWAMSKDECLRRLNNYRPQKPEEWSEEDEDILNCCISSIEEAKENRYAYKETDGDTSYDREIAWLKSLRPSWKPSKEQMKALSDACCIAFEEERDFHPSLSRLYHDLRKLIRR